MKNLLQETIECLNEGGKSPKDVLWCGLEDEWFTWEDFAAVANIEYDSGFGTEEIPLDLVIVGKDFWIERHEHDGAEWWEYKSLPSRPEVHIIPGSITK